MYVKSHLVAVLATALSLHVAATPFDQSSAPRGSDLRLIKTSEEDPGTWVTEDEKIEKYVAKNIGFIDITDIKVGSLD